MFFLVDLVLLLILAFVIFASIKFGFTRNFIFGILRTVIGIAGGVGACYGIYLLMDAFGWLNYLADPIVQFFGNQSWFNAANPVNIRIVAEIIAYVPFAVLFLILGYILVHWLINLLVKLVFAPIFTAKEKIKAVKIIDNVLGLILNLGLYLGFVFALFGFIHAVNTVEFTAGDYVYDDVSAVIFQENDDPDALTDFVSTTIDNFTGPMFNNWHESLSASPIGSLVYEYNPFNGLFEGIVKGMFGIE